MGKEELKKEVERYSQHKPKKAVKLSKREYKLSQRALKKAKINKEGKDAIREAKQQVKLKRKVLKSQYKRAGGSGTQKVVRKGYKTSRRMGEASVSEHDVMGEIAGKRQTIRQSKYSLQKSKQLGKNTFRAGKKIGGSTYSLTNRGYNLARGNGFTRTLKADRWETKVATRLNKIRQRVVRTRVMKAGKVTFKVLNWLSSPLKQILLNPLTIKSYLIAFIMVVIAAAYLGNPSSMQQNEFNLNDSWLHFSKLDRLRSNEEVDYWTNIDEVLQYTNFVYQDYRQTQIWEDPSEVSHRRFQESIVGGNPDSSKTMSDMEYSIWYNLNNDKEHLRTMRDLYGPDSHFKWKLSEKKLAEFEELLEIAKETGYYRSYQELENPIYSKREEGFGQPLVITKRYGYSSKDDIYNNTIIQVARGKQLYASMAGTVNVSEKSITIETSRAKFTYYNVSEIRVKTGDNVTVGQELAKVDSDEGLEISYQKLKTNKDKTSKEWLYVNVGFYLPSVHYNQTTSVLSTIDIGDMAGRIKETSDYVKKYEPKATINGISAMLGNFWTESSITSKRAEGDYLTPPIGASASSWDDPNWLSISGPAIYNGSYPNILKRGLGLGQWTDTGDGSVRHTLLLQYAHQKGKKWYDLELQIDFIFNGDAPYYREIAHDILTSNDDVESLTERFLVRWEGNSGDKLLERQNNAKQVAQFLKNPVGGSSSLVASWNFPKAYRSKISNFPSEATVSSTAQGSGYPIGQCTWYAYNRLVELGSITDLSGAFGYLGNGQDWVRNLIAKGWRFSNAPIKGAVVSTVGGFDGTPSQYGHVGIVEAVNPDGTFLVSECNWGGIQNKIHWRVCRPSMYYTFATPK
ncbi:phage tail tip lysozyme [Streptococcus suis]|uniref:phage tail tip lysozyme n=1 Tax=Streptococcus suis TaxID=1307 RepID=UPI0003F98E3C|nr:phage tail tip lysozyme [Streptococcus suis]HEM3208177.1 CHAP domain-containing protein [Streptococcus suis 4417]HEM5111619.1 CHAP domain-containing protein [Streptococcus suis]